MADNTKYTIFFPNFKELSLQVGVGGVSKIEVDQQNNCLIATGSNNETIVKVLNMPILIATEGVHSDIMADRQDDLPSTLDVNTV